jgi:hypothetical protein
MKFIGIIMLSLTSLILIMGQSFDAFAPGILAQAIAESSLLQLCSRLPIRKRIKYTDRSLIF